MQASAAGRPLAAGGMIVLAVAMLAYIDNFIRVVAAESGMWQFHITRAALVALILAAGAAVFGWRLRPRNLRAVVLRSIVLASSMVLYFGAAAVMPIAQVGAGLFTAPVFVLLLSAAVWRVKVGPWRWLAVGLGFAGVIAVLRPDPANLTLITLLPVIAGFLYAVASLLTRHLCAEEGTMALQAAFFAVMVVFSVLGLVVLTLWPGLQGESFFNRGWVAMPGRDFWIWTVGQSVVSLMGLGLITRAYQIADPSRITVFEYAFLVFASLWGYLLWRDMLDVWGWLGMAAIAGAGTLIALRSAEVERPA